MLRVRLASIVSVALVLGACFDDLESKNRQNAGGNGNGPPPVANQSPTISGSAPPAVLEGEPYEFMPSASDPDGDSLKFSIARKPGWATFDAATGRLAGTPDAADVGNFTNITITVSDGRASASLSAFDITVDQIAFGTATLSWNPPTENVDGSSLTNLAGYRIYYGRNKNLLNRSVVLDNPGLTSYMIENLTPARWHFAMTSVNSDGTESRRSSTVNKKVS